MQKTNIRVFVISLFIKPIAELKISIVKNVKNIPDRIIKICGKIVANFFMRFPPLTYLAYQNNIAHFTSSVGWNVGELTTKHHL